jgi:hypothetical protein
MSRFQTTYIEYPVAQKAAYDRLVSRIAASLAGGCGIYQ